MDGVLIIDKAPGMTSHDVVARVRKIIGERRTGHTGTLDPFASGVLVILVGRATRLAQFLSGAEKEYEAIIRLGYATDTGDITGRRAEKGFTAETQSTQRLRREEIEMAMASLRGKIEQIPPMYSAKKVGGRKLYELARRGEEIERKAVRVTINQFEALPNDDLFLKTNEDDSHDLKVRVVCSRGTYIRALAEDLGKELGIGAHLAGLRRMRAGRFKIGDAITLDRLSELAKSDSIAQVLVSPYDALEHLPAVELTGQDVKRVRQGIDLTMEGPAALSWADGQAARMRDADEKLIAVGVYNRSRKIIHPAVVLSNQH